MEKEFNYENEKVFIIKFTTNYGTFEFDLDFVNETQENTLELLNHLRKQTFS